MKSLFHVLPLLFFFSTICSQSTDDESSIKGIVQTMSDAWTAGDANKWSSVFADDHDFVVWMGHYLPNSDRARNAAGHERIFSTMYKDTKQFAIVDKIRFIEDDVALIHVLAAVVPQGTPKPSYPHVLWTGVLTKENNYWKIVSFHNLDLEIIENKEMQYGANVDEMFSSWSKVRS